MQCSWRRRGLERRLARRLSFTNDVGLQVPHIEFTEIFASEHHFVH